MDAQSRDILLLAEYGSRAYGAATDTSDHDMMGIYLESEHQIYGLDTATTRQTSLGRRSTSEDTDLTLHPLRKYVALAAKGNPTVLSLLWTPEYLIERITPAAELLIKNRDLFITKQVITAHLGYALSQRLAMTGQRTMRTNRPELVQQHGYDTKFAMHLIRLLIQGLELVTHRGYTLPMNDADLHELRAVRTGQYTIEQVLARADQLTAQLQIAEQSSDLPAHPDQHTVNELLVALRHTATRNHTP